MKITLNTPNLVFQKAKRLCSWLHHLRSMLGWILSKELKEPIKLPSTHEAPNFNIMVNTKQEIIDEGEKLLTIAEAFLRSSIILKVKDLRHNFKKIKIHEEKNLYANPYSKKTVLMFSYAIDSVKGLGFWGKKLLQVSLECCNMLLNSHKLIIVL